MHASSIQDFAERWALIKSIAAPSPNTVVAREYDLNAIAKLLPGGSLAAVQLSDLSVESLQAAFDSYQSTHAASSTKRVMSTWRQFCRWLVRERLIPANPMDLIDAPPKAAWVPKPLPIEDLAAIAETSRMQSTVSRNPWPERDEAIFALLAGGGLRISEVISLEIGDCYLTDKPARLRVNGKGKKARVVPIPPEAVARLKSYLTSREKRVTSESEDRLLLRPDGRPMTRSAADYVIRGWFQRANRTPPPGAVAHSFRHAYATMLIESGVSLPEVQQLLGHSDLATTQAYIGVTVKGLEDAVMSNPARSLL